MTAVEITGITKIGGPLTKRISLADDGSLKNDSSACVMSNGTAQRVQITDVEHFARIVGSLRPDKAIALGALRTGLPDKVDVVTKARLNGNGAEHVIARTNSNIVFQEGRAAYVLLDYDSKGMPGSVAELMRERGGFYQTLISIMPELANVARVIRRSTSAGLYRADTGERLPGSDGMHVYLSVRDGSDSERFLKALHERCWLAGLGWLMVGAGGQLLERSIVDRTVGSPERLVFEAPPLLDPPLAQDKESRRPLAVSGEALDTVAACPPLNATETARLRALKAAAARALDPEVAKARDAFIARQTQRIVERTGASPEQAARAAARQIEGTLLPTVELPFDDPMLAGCTVADVLADPDKFEGATLSDPLEGPEYGTGKAKLMRRRDGSMWIHSFAHGRTVYELHASADAVTVEDFYAFMPMHSYLCVPSREMWPAGSINARIAPMVTGQKSQPASAWLDQHRAVEQMTWAPGMPMLIRDKVIAEGGWSPQPCWTCFNLYRPPSLDLGDPYQAQRWLDHIHRVYDEEAVARHIVKWLAHRVQRPHEKINHALVLGGAQGIGKDTLLEPVKHAVGAWNFCEVSPGQIMGRFNGFLKSVILRISEARDLGETDRYKFYDHLKAYIASPPDVLRVDEKHLREHHVLNVTGVIQTTNYKTGGIYLPADDRRHFVAWSERTKESFTDTYWTDLWGWYHGGGIGHVGAYLAALDLADFDAKAPPPKTPAFWDIVDASRAPEDAELADALDKLGNPDAVTVADILANADSSAFHDWLSDRKNRRQIPHRFEQCGYSLVRNPYADDGLWKIVGRRQAIYAKTNLPNGARVDAATSLTR